MAHEYSNMLFTTANHWSLCRARTWQSTNSAQKSVVGKYIYQVVRQELTENLYALWSACKSCAPVRFMLYMSGNISGVPFNNVKPTLSGRIEGGIPVPIEQHPHQVKLLNCC